MNCWQKPRETLLLSKLPLDYVAVEGHCIGRDRG